MRLRTVIAAALLLAPAAFGAPGKVTAKRVAQPENTAYAQAQDAYARLRKDKDRRKFRHNWLNIARRFETVAVKYGATPYGPEAVYSAAGLYDELSRFSSKDDDRDAATRNYRKLISTWPRHPLAGSAVLAYAHLLADREGNVDDARELLSKNIVNARPREAAEMKSFLALLKPTAKSPSPGPTRDKMDELLHHAFVRAGRVAQATAEAGESPARTAPSSKEKAAASDLVAPHPSGTAVATARKPTSPGESPRVPPPTPDDASVAAVDSDAESATLPPKTSPWKQALRALANRQPARDDKVKNADDYAEVPLAQQLGLKVRKVVLDPGHGGHDTGAIGKNGTREKDVTLKLAKLLADKLRKAGLTVVLTRDDDTYVRLEDRTQTANRERGDLFISLHCNAAPSRQTSGVETYTLNTSADRFAIRLAAQENATSEKGVSDLQYILADLAAKANTGESVQLASLVQRSVVRKVASEFSGVQNLGTKEALFFVLLGAKMPSILVEAAFLSNLEEEKRLNSARYLDLVSEAIADGVNSFLSNRQQIAQVR